MKQSDTGSGKPRGEGTKNKKKRKTNRKSERVIRASN